MIAERVSGFDLDKLMGMTDRQIVCVYFPGQVVKPVAGGGISHKDAFWMIGKGRGLTESQILKAWKESGGT